ncbi:hypothetical protein D3C78_780600 [compost metagenome]
MKTEYKTLTCDDLHIFRHLRDNAKPLLCLYDDSFTKGVLRIGFTDGGNSQQFVFICFVRFYPGHTGVSDRYSTCLVKRDHMNSPQFLHDFAALYKNSVLCTVANTSDNGNRGRYYKCARACDHEKS